jgi:hypothetical protein
VPLMAVATAPYDDGDDVVLDTVSR